jgi:hypothetical protein
MDNDGHRAAVEAAYARLREKLEAKDVSADGLKQAALEALATARTLVEIEDGLAPGEQAPGREMERRDLK